MAVSLTSRDGFDKNFMRGYAEIGLAALLIECAISVNGMAVVGASTTSLSF